MPHLCMVVNCGSNSTRDRGEIRFFRMPSIYSKGRKVVGPAMERRERWIAAIKRDDLTEAKLKFGRVCSKHFIRGYPADLADKDNPDWVPSLNMGHSSANLTRNLARYERVAARREKASTSVSCTPSQVVDHVEVPTTSEATIEQSPSVEQLQLALRRANEEIYKLREEVKKYKLDEDHFINNDVDTNFYTGLPGYTYLKNVFSLVEPFLAPYSALSKFQQLVLTLMKLRLNLSFTDLGKRFQCHPSTASKIFERVVNIMYRRLKCFIEWPERDNLRKYMPHCFNNVFGDKTTVIIDCFEVFIEKPGNLEAAAKTFSHYKHHNTMKFLLGISPQGVIIFVSNAYGGRASDKFITEDSGILNNLITGDMVLADRGFSISESVRLYCAEIRCPAYLKGKKQLSATDIESTRKIASVRIHVERVIGQLKLKYKILTGVFPMSQLKKGNVEFALIDQIVVVCCALINLCPSVVPYL